MKKVLSLLVILLPWKIRRFLLIKIWKYEIHPSARIGLAYVYPKKLKMEKGSRISHFNVGINLDAIIIKENSIIDRSNWITGFPSGTKLKHFQHRKNRISELHLGKEASITKNHHFDCTEKITIGDFSTIAGYNSQFLTHSVNLVKNIQDCHPINIGKYCFVGTNSVVLGGASLPSFSALGAKSMLNKPFKEEYMLYGGSPTKAIKPMDKQCKYFKRKEGFII